MSDTIRLSPQQRRIWLAGQAAGAPLRARCELSFEGSLDAVLLRAALDAQVERHEILRTTFELPAWLKVPQQVIGESAAFAWIERMAPAGAADSFANSAIDLTRGPVLHATLTSWGSDRHVLALELPALCADLRSLANLASEIERDYVARRDGNPSMPGEEPLQYADYSEWQHELAEAPENAKSAAAGRAYWQRQDLSPARELRLPFERRSGVDSTGPFRPAEVSLDLGRDPAASLATTAGAIGIPPDAVLLTVWSVLLWRLSGQAEVMIGRAFDGRKVADLAGAIGAISRCLPVRAVLNPRLRFRDAATQVQGAIREADDRLETCDWEESLKLADGEPVSPFGFESEAVRPIGPSVSLGGQSVWTERCRAKLSCFHGPQTLRVAVGFDAEVFEPEAARRVGRQFAALLEQVTADPEVLLGDLDSRTAEDRALAAALNDTAAAAPAPRCFHEIFADQAARTPEHVALVFEGEKLTYAELDEQANRLAQHLAALGVGPEVRVALFLERSLEMVVVLLAVLKAGGAYVPLDPAYPAERLAAMLEECGAEVAVGQDHLLANLSARAPRIVRLTAEAEAIARRPAVAPRSGVGPANLAYLLFTSGSTGRPKGVAVEHRQLAHYLDSILRELAPEAGDGFATVSTFGADLGNTVVFPSLATGGTLHVLSEERISDAEAVAQYFERHGIDFLKIVPSHLAALAAGGLSRVLPRKVLVLGGEATSPDLIDRLRAEASPAVLNHYGPTETTVGVATCRLDRGAVQDAGRLPLGRPLANTRIHLLDPFGVPVPAGVAGEVHIGGAGVARGYWGRCEATAERFVPDPFSSHEGGRLYRTGDLARLLADGRLEFVGRADQQVKIRGFRIEPGEIEAAMRRHPAVREAIVLVREEKPGIRRLAGFATLHRGAAPTPLELRAELLRVLPDYMVPPVLQILDALPLTPNGKVDRQALLRLEADAEPARPRIAVAPRDAKEELLAQIWREVLGVPRVGIHDNFFELGGDSILVIQVIARAGKEGLRFNPRQFFEHQTIAELSSQAGASPEVFAEQGAVAGPVALTPIQRWFFDLECSEPHHWNQAVALEPREDLDPAWIEAALSAVVSHHDALRSRFERTGEGWRQEVLPVSGALRFERHDLSAPVEDQDVAFAALAERVQSGLDLAAPPLLQAAWVELGPGRGRRLLLAVHHLVIDGVSWRVILEDLGAALRQKAAGEPIALPAKSTSFQQWAAKLGEYARSGALGAEIDFWRQADQPAPPLPFDDLPGEDVEAFSRTVSVALDVSATDRLLHALPKICRAQINEILLSALLRTFGGWTGETALRLDLEGHGREPLFDDVDLSRTVGWFTTHFPVWLEAPADAGPVEALRATKERLRAIPGRGIGYGLLRYLSEDGAALSAAPPEVSFNYLGQLDASFDGSPFRRAEEPAGANRAASARRPYRLQVSAMVLSGRLQIDWGYGRSHNRDTVERLAQSFVRNLEELLGAAGSGEPLAWIAADFPLAKIGQEALDALLARSAPEDLYPLSPLQEGLLFHSLYEPGSGLYIGQLDCLLVGDLDVESLERAWRQVVSRHSIFRTSFVWEGLDRPLQRVAPEAELSIERQDWSGCSEADREGRREAWLGADRQLGYDLSRAPLMRIALCRRDETSWEMLWSHHHLLLDGWSLALLAQDLFGLYARIRSGLAVEPPAARPYRDYIEWLERRDLAPARSFWQRALAGFGSPNSLDGVRTGKVTGDAQGLKDQWLSLAPVATGRLQEWQRRHQITLNTLVQGVWAVLLSHLSGDRDVVFGSTVAGRPTELAGFESMIGVFINTLPVRAEVDPGAELVAWLSDLQVAQVEARQFESTPLVEIQGWSELPRGVPLFESVMVVENYPVGDPGDRGFEIREMRYSMKENFPLIFTVLPGAELRVKVKYDSALFSRAAISRMADLFLALLERIAAAPDVRLADLSALLTEADRKRESDGEKSLKDLRAQKFEQVRRKAVPVP